MFMKINPANICQAYEPKPKSAPKPLTNEIDINDRDPRSFFSQDAAIFVGDIDRSDVTKINLQNLPQSTIHQLNAQMQLLRTIRQAQPSAAENPWWQHSPQHSLKDLAASFDYILKNSNSGSANRHMEDAFTSLARVIHGRSGGTNQEAELFAKIFLDNYKKHGMEAFNIAMQQIISNS
jgi:hypothetical protein